MKFHVALIASCCIGVVTSLGTSSAAQISNAARAMASESGQRTAIELPLLDMVAPLHGWAIGQLVNSSSPFSSVFRTVDGGKEWVNVTPPHMISSKFVLNDGYATRNSVWIATVVPDKTLQVYRTTDGGRTWADLHPVEVRSIRSST